MNQNKLFIFIFIFISILNSNSIVYGQELKPLASSMDINAASIETATNSSEKTNTSNDFTSEAVTNQPENELQADNISTNTTVNAEGPDNLSTEIKPDAKININDSIKEINNDLNALHNDLNSLNSKINSDLSTASLNTTNLNSASLNHETLNNSEEPANTQENENKIQEANNPVPAEPTNQESTTITKPDNNSIPTEPPNQESITITKPDNNPEANPDIKVKVSKHDTEIQKEADEIELELRQEEPVVLKDLRSLWSAAVEKSATIRLAIQKLSNPDDTDKKDVNMVSKVLSPLASLAPLAAMASSSTTQTAGALLGGGLLGTLSSNEDSEYNKAMMRISDYDLIMLAKAVDELQAKLITNYYDYKQSLERLTLAEEALKNSKILYDKARKSTNIGSSTASEAFYKESQQEVNKARQNMYTARTSLEQLVGNPAIIFIETNNEEVKKELDEAKKIESDKTNDKIVKGKEKSKEKNIPVQKAKHKEVPKTVGKQVEKQKPANKKQR